MVIYLDGASLSDIEKYAGQVQGFTTNPSLCRKSGVTNYRKFADEVLARVDGKPVSFEVLADDFPTMEKQAQIISEWGDNVWVKIPVMNSKGESSLNLIDRIQDLNLNITAVMTEDQMISLGAVDRKHHIISIFAGRMADTGVDPTKLFAKSKRFLRHGKTLWASTREVYNYYQAEYFTADIITMSPELLGKLNLYGKDLHEYSRETVEQFYMDGKGLEL